MSSKKTESKSTEPSDTIVAPLADPMQEARTRLVALYENGEPDEDDETEAGDINNLSKYDRYGFLCDTVIPLTDDEKSHEREKQASWLKIIQKWDVSYPSKNVKKKIFNGVPEPMKAEVWKRILEVPHEISLNPGYYEDVGYCQGMANVAALLLMFMNEEDAFWSFSTLLSSKKYSMHGFFVQGFRKLIRFQLHHEQILQKLLPKLYVHLETEGIHSSLYTLKWYMQCFLDIVPFSLAIRLWDVFILEGDKILHPIGYTLLKMHSSNNGLIRSPHSYHSSLEKLLNMSMEEMAEFLTSSIQKIEYDEDEFMIRIKKNIVDLKKHGLYPAPSVVEGELPSEKDQLYSSVSERKISRKPLNKIMMEIDSTIHQICLHSVNDNESITQFESSIVNSAHSQSTHSFKTNSNYTLQNPNFGIPSCPKAPAPNPLAPLVFPTVEKVDLKYNKSFDHDHKDISKLINYFDKKEENSFYSLDQLRYSKFKWPQLN